MIGSKSAIANASETNKVLAVKTAFVSEVGQPEVACPVLLNFEQRVSPRLSDSLTNDWRMVFLCTWRAGSGSSPRRMVLKRRHAGVSQTPSTTESSTCIVTTFQFTIDGDSF